MLSKICAREVTFVGTTVFARPTVNEMVNRPASGLSLAIDGRIVYRHRGREFVSDPDHLIVFPMGGSYTLDCRAAGRFTLVNFLPALPMPTDTFLSIPITKREEFLSAHRRLEQIARRTDEGRGARLLSGVYELLAIAAESAETTAHAPRTASAILYIREHLADPLLRCAQIAASVGVGEVYLRRLFFKETGLSPAAYLQKERLAEARRLLVETSDTVSHIAEACGYADVYVFCHAFKRESGKTPTEYRTATRGII